MLLGSTASADAPTTTEAPLVVEAIVAEEPKPKPSKRYACEDWRHLVEQYDWDVDLALRVMEKESSCNPTATNPEAHRNRDGSVFCYGSYGLMQVSCHDGVLYDPAENIAVAYRKYKAGGWSPWGVCNFERTCAVLQ
jgi:soluble lytic murein transglycosylase-like protein